MTEGGYDKRKNYFMNIIVRAYNEGVAFRYHFPETTNGLFYILQVNGQVSQCLKVQWLTMNVGHKVLMSFVPCQVGKRGK